MRWEGLGVWPDVEEAVRREESGVWPDAEDEVREESGVWSVEATPIQITSSPALPRGER